MRTLDALVAERVMGWTWGEIDGERVLLGPITGDIQAVHWPARPSRPSRVDDIWNMPAYSTDIAAAWMVVSHLTSDEYAVNVFCAKNGSAIVDFYCPHGPCLRHGSTSINYGHGSGEISADTAPLAICIAALRAVGVTQDEIDAAMKQEIDA